MFGRIAIASAMLCLAGALSRADDKPLDRLELDRRIVNVVYETAVLGTDIYNKGKHEECFRLYQGALIGLQPMLDHRPLLMDSVKSKLGKARGMKAIDGAFTLREALDEIQNEIAPPPSKSDAKVEPKPEIKPEKTVTLWDRLGGEKTVRAIVKDFIAAAVEDKKVNFFRDGKIKQDEKGRARMEQLFVELISIFGQGPLDYSEKRTLKDVHAGMRITDAEFDASLAVLQKTLEKHKIGKAESEELMKHFSATRRVIVAPKD